MMKRMKSLLLILVLGVSLLLPGCGAKSQENSLIGTWILDCSYSFPRNGYFFQYFTEGMNSCLYSVSFYEDGSYAAEIRFIFDWDLEPGEAWNGKYDVVHDGSTISFDESGYYNFEINDGDLKITDEGGRTFLYHRSETLGETECFKVAEVDGMPLSGYSSDDMLLIFQRDHRVIFCARQYGEDGDYRDVIVDNTTDITWEHTDTGLVLYDHEMEQEVGVCSYQGDNLIIESEGTYIVCSRMELYELQSQN